MTMLARVRVPWTGTAVVGPSVSTFYFNDAGTGFTANLVSFFDAIKNRVPPGVTWSVPNSGDIINDATGDLEGVWQGGTAQQVTGTGAALYSQGVGFRFVWNTGGVRGGRRVRGSTFICPMDGAMLDATGTLGSAQMATLVTAATSVITDSPNELRIWSKPHTGLSDGTSHAVTSVTVPDAISWLRSRRT